MTQKDSSCHYIKRMYVKSKRESNQFMNVNVLLFEAILSSLLHIMML